MCIRSINKQWILDRHYSATKQNISKDYTQVFNKL